ncbi:MAG TPA: hypothetical protein VGH79_05715 [Gaiellaceae bacterium]|jgi:hypothetical protein
METYRQHDRMTIMQRGGPAGVTVVITEAPAGTSPRWTIDYYPASRYGRGAHAFTDTSDTAPIPDDFSDVLMWAKRRWSDHLHEHKAA